MSNVPDFCWQQLIGSGRRHHKSYYTIPPTRSEGAKAPLSTLPSSLVTTRRSLRCSSKSLLCRFPVGWRSLHQGDEVLLIPDA